MTLSIWIILIIIVAVAFWFFYKKNKFKLKKPVVKTVKKKETKYTLTNIDKMLANVTQKEVISEETQVHSEKQEEILSQVDQELSENSFPQKDKKQGFDFKSGIITSILLKKKEDL